jgi:enoyl-[acyl-carrier protein] reductase III
MSKGAALISGGTRGIGRAITIRLAEDGYNPLFVNYLQNDEEAHKTNKLVESNGTKCILLKANLASADEIDHMFEEITSHNKQIGVFVHSAALNTFKPLSSVKMNQWDLTLNINSRGFLYCSQKCVPQMTEGSSIVAISSLGSERVLPNYGAMGPAKSALESIVRYLAVELSDNHIRVNAVRGGIIQTDSIYKFPDVSEWLEDLIKHTPAKKIGKPKDIANAVSFLCSDSARFIFGEVLVVDGGLSLK